MRLLAVSLTHAIKTAYSRCALATVLAIFACSTANCAVVSSTWDQPATALADRIAAILGPGLAHLTLRNLSTISNDELPSIRSILEQDLRAHGISSTTDDAANLLRITLSENQRERLWIAEVVEGTEIKVVMVRLDIAPQPATPKAAGITLRRERILSSHEPILAALEFPAFLVTLEPEQIRIYTHSAASWTQQTAVAIRQKRPLARDPRGILNASDDGMGLAADAPGAHCDGAYSALSAAGPWTINCHESDDPWPVAIPLKAFYNATRDYFTGVVAPSPGVELPAFYSAAQIPHAGTTALLLNSIDGKLQLIENSAIRPVAGARDWGSDFAALHSSCGSGTQLVASGSGPAAQDSLRAYELPALEAIPASAPLAFDGSITALWSAPDGKSIFAVVRTSTQQGQPIEYEVDRVTATCN